MDVNDVSEVVRIGNGLVQFAKGLRGALGDSSEVVELDKAIDKIEAEWRRGQAELAKALGYPLCRRHWPPGIMVFDHYDEDSDLVHKCQDCGETDERPSSEPLPERRERI